MPRFHVLPSTSPLEAPTEAQKTWDVRFNVIVIVVFSSLSISLQFDSSITHFTMSGILSQVPIVNRILGLGTNRQAISLPSVEVHDIETNPDKRARCLKHLLKANHANYSIVYHNLHYDNHNAHILSSAYLLGASVPQLNDIYDREIRELEPWVPSPAEIGEDDWQELRGDGRYQRAFVDFFEDKLVMRFHYDWHEELSHYLFTGDEPLFHGLIGGRMFACWDYQVFITNDNSRTPPYSLRLCL